MIPNRRFVWSVCVACLLGLAPWLVIAPGPLVLAAAAPQEEGPRPKLRIRDHDDGHVRPHDHGHPHDHTPPPRVPPEEEHRPSAIPDRIILTWTGDPARTQAVTWRTDPSVARGLAQIAPALENGRDLEPAARTVEAVSCDLSTDLGPSRHHTVEFTDLAPGQLYAYRVGDGTNWSEWNHFRTASEGAEPFSFIYFGDAQNEIKSLWSRVIREAYAAAPRARFMIHAGDLVNRANSDAEWGEWFAAGGWLNAVVPSIAVPGNHEYQRAPRPESSRDSSGTAPALAEPLLSGHWRPQFAFPQNGPEGLEESVYSLDYQGVRIVGLNSNVRHREQAEWLERVLAERPPSISWTILTFHHPVYSSAKGRDNPTIRALWQPVFDRHAVDLVLQGHDHTYARSGLRVHDNVPSGRNVRDPQRGTVYVVSVSGPKMYELQQLPDMKRRAEDTQLFQVISIDGPTLRYEARTATGLLYDAFTLRKRPGLPNELIDEIPATPERRRTPKREPAKAASRSTP